MAAAKQQSAKSSWVACLAHKPANPAWPRPAAPQMSDAFFAAAAQLGKPALAWTADTPADLHRAAQARLNAVVSNRPIALRAVLMDWRDRCSERQRRQRQAARRLAGDGGSMAGSLRLGGTRQR